MERVNVFAFYNAGSALRRSFHGLEPDDENIAAHLMIAKAELELLLANPVARQLPLTDCRGRAIISSLENKLGQVAPSGDSNEFGSLRDHEVRSLKTRYNQFEQLLAEELARAAVYAVHRKGIADTGLLIDNADEVIPETLRSRLGQQCLNDLRQAGRCLAFELPTAVGFHLMRATEVAMWAYWEHLKDAQRPTNSNWGTAIKQLEEAGADAKVLAALKQVKDLHRNPVMHPEVVLDMEEALALWAVAPGIIIVIARCLTDDSEPDEPKQLDTIELVSWKVCYMM